MSRYNKDLGDFGEDTAVVYLVNCGYEILCRNFCVKGGEIDIVARDNDTIVFIEVKTRSSTKYGYPSEAVDHKKLMNMRHAAEMYILKNPTESEMRFDVIEVYAVLRDGIPQFDELNHIKEIVID